MSNMFYKQMCFVSYVFYVFYVFISKYVLSKCVYEQYVL
jgi:hypothetical protein